jgi:hypothetical protein
MSPSLWKRIQNILTSPPNEQTTHKHDGDGADIVNACCDQPQVHIAYRGKSDDRLYLTKNRTWQEVRFFAPNGLRVFCKQCRRRVY